MKLSLSPKNFGAHIGKHPSIVSWLLMAGILFGVLFNFWQLLTIILNARQITPPTSSKAIRINFQAYDSIVNGFKAAENYTPPPITQPNPFGSLGEKKK